MKTKTDFDAKLSSLFLSKNYGNKTKHLLLENELEKLKTNKFYWQESFWRRWYRKLFSVSTAKQKFKVITNTDYVSSWKSKGLSAESIKPPTTSDNSLTPIWNYYSTKTRVKFTGSCLK